MRYNKNGKEIELFYLSDEDIDSIEYRDFINSAEFRKFMHYPDTNLYDVIKEKIEYYKSFYDFKILCVKIDGSIVGQSCAFRTVAIINGAKCDWWWGVDMYLLSGCRGLGIGKELQKILHETLPNFSSAWYTPINGIIKEKCGAHGIFDIWFNYYPVSSALTVFGDLCFRKLFKLPLPIRISIPFCYSTINGLFCNSRLKGYEISEIPYDRMGENESFFIEKTLASKNFHIERSTLFLKWKYKSLKAGYHMLIITKNDFVEAIIAFSNIYNTRFDSVPIKCVSIYDMVIAPESALSDRQLLLYIANWYRDRKENFDGFQMIARVKYFGRICYPFHSCKVLSTIDGKFDNSYLTLADQDMDQI